MTRRSLTDLLDTADPAWPLVLEWVAQAEVPVEVLPPSPRAGDCLVSLQITTHSSMGAIVYHTGGLLIDHGWLRLLGSGHPRLNRSLLDWNVACGNLQSQAPPPMIIIGDDVLGGTFAINGGRWGSSDHNVWYFAPDTLRWEDLKIGYSDFVTAFLSRRISKFYEPYRWQGWEGEVEKLTGDQALFVYPFLFTQGPSIAERDRKPIAFRELISLYGPSTIASLSPPGDTEQQ